MQNIIPFSGNWTSTKEIEVLDYNSNFSNWIDAIGTPGHFRFTLDLTSGELKNCRVLIPVVDVYGDKSYFAIYYGRFELASDQILIWQNEEVPVTIDYEWSDDI
jgi:hypothetical protein